MAGLIEEHIRKARESLAEAEAEYWRAHREVGVEVIKAWRSSYEKGWLAVLHACAAFFIKQGVPQEELHDVGPGIQRQVDYLARHYILCDEAMHGQYTGLWLGYHDRIHDFEDMPDFYLKDI